MKSIEATGQGHRENNVRRLRIGHLSTFYHTAITMMAKPEFLKDVEAEVEWRLFGTGPDIVNAFERGQIDLAYVGLPPAIIGIDRGVPIMCVAGGHMEGTVLSGMKALAGFPEVNDIRSILKQFHGCKVGVPGKGSIHDVILKNYIEKYRLNHNIEVVNFPWADMITEAFVKGDIVAACGTPALAQAIKRFAGGKILCPPSMLWPNNPSYGILVTAEFLSQKQSLVEKFLVAHENVTAYIRNTPLQAAQAIADYVGFIDSEFIFDTLMLSPRYCAYLSDAFRSSTMEFVTALKKIGYIKRLLREKEIFYMNIIRRIHPSVDHYHENIIAK